MFSSQYGYAKLMTIGLIPGDGIGKEVIPVSLLQTRRTHRHSPVSNGSLLGW
jgi:isocitrate/isopropylmalate dehydrogenase